MYYDAATLLKATKRLAKALQLINSSELSSLGLELLSAADQLAAAIASPVPAVSLQKAGFELSIATAELCAIVAKTATALNFNPIFFFKDMTVSSLAAEAGHISVVTAKFSVTAWSPEEISVAAAKLSAASAKLSATAEQKVALKLSAAAKNLLAATSPIHAGKLFLDEALFTELFQQDADGLSPLMTAVNDHGAPKKPQKLLTTLRTLRTLDAQKQGKLIGQCNHQNQNVFMFAAQFTNGALSKLLEVWPSLPLEDQIKIFTQSDKNGRNLLLLVAERNSPQLSEILTLIQSFESKVQAMIFEQCSDQWGIIISAIRRHPQAMSKLRAILLTLDLDHSKRFLEKLQSEDWAQIREIAQKDQIFSAALAERIKAAEAHIPTKNLDATTFHHLVQLATSSFLSQLDQDIQEGTAASLSHFETILSLLKHSSRISDFTPFFQNMIQKLFSYYPKAMEQEAELAPIAKQTSVLRLIQSILQQLSWLEEDLDQENTLDNLLILTIRYSPPSIAIILKGMQYLEQSTQARIFKQYNASSQNPLMLAIAQDAKAAHLILEAMHSLDQADQSSIFQQRDTLGWSALTLAALNHSSAFPEILATMGSLPKENQAIILKQCSPDGLRAIILAVRGSDQAMTQLRISLFCLAPADSKELLEKLQGEHWEQIREILPGKVLLCAGLAHWIKRSQAQIPSRYLGKEICNELITMYFEEFFILLDHDIREGATKSLSHFKTILSLLKHSSRISDFAPFFQQLIQKLFDNYPKTMEQGPSLTTKQQSVLMLIQGILQQLSWLEEDLDQENTIANLLILTLRYSPQSIQTVLEGMKYLEKSTQTSILRQGSAFRKRREQFSDEPLAEEADEDTISEDNAYGTSALMLAVAEDAQAARFILAAIRSLDQDDRLSILQQRDKFGWNALTLAALTHSPVLPDILAAIGSLSKNGQATVLKQCDPEGLQVLIFAVGNNNAAMLQLRFILLALDPVDSKELLEKLQDKHWEQIRKILPGKDLLCAGLAHWIKRSQAQIARRYLGAEICHELIIIDHDEFFTQLDQDLREGARHSLSHFETILSSLKHSSRISDFAPFFQQLIQKLCDNYPKTGRQGTSLTTKQQTVLTLIQCILQQLSLSELGPLKDIKLGKNELQQYCKLKYFSSESFAINIAELLVFNSFFTKSDWARLMSGQQKNCSKIIQQIQTYQKASSTERPELSALLQNLQQTAPSSTERSGFAATLARVFSRRSRGRESAASDENGYHA